MSLNSASFPTTSPKVPGPPISQKRKLSPLLKATQQTHGERSLKLGSKCTRLDYIGACAHPPQTCHMHRAGHSHPVRVPTSCPTAPRQPAQWDTAWSRAGGALIISPGAEASHQPGVSMFPRFMSPVTHKGDGVPEREEAWGLLPSSAADTPPSHE